MNKDIGEGLAPVCYGLAAAVIGGWLFASGANGVRDAGASVLAIAGLLAVYGLIRLGRAFGSISDRTDVRE